MITHNALTLIEKLHQHPANGVFVATGGGARFFSNILTVPGASQTVMECIIPYSTEALDDFLGFSPTQYCSKETSISAAIKAYERGKFLFPNYSPHPQFGLAITASLISSTPKRGEHRAYLSILDGDKIYVTQIILAKNRRSRCEEEDFLSHIVLNELAQIYALETYEYPLLPEDYISRETIPYSPLIEQLFQRTHQAVWYHQDHGYSTTKLVQPKGILSGAFNPLHQGHEQLRLTAEMHLKGPVVYELPVIHADKPSLSPGELILRITQFKQSYLAITDVPLFVDKARQFPGTCFVIGMDTAHRLLHPQFYQDSVSQLESALKRIQDQGCYFLVAARTFDGHLHTSHELSVKSSLLDLFVEIPVEDFLMDISSTQLRNAHSQGPES